MRYFKPVKKLAEALAKILIHNPYLLNNEEELAVALECHIAPCAGEAYLMGREDIVVETLVAGQTPNEIEN